MSSPGKIGSTPPSTRRTGVDLPLKMQAYTRQQDALPHRQVVCVCIHGSHGISLQAVKKISSVLSLQWSQAPANLLGTYKLYTLIMLLWLGMLSSVPRL